MSLFSRGREISRIESFSDAIFGFSATLLVVSLEVPTRFDQLIAELKGFGAFGLSFLALVMIWLVHRAFFKRFPLDDKIIVLLNSILLFVVLFYVYPLKYVTISIAQMIFGTSGTSYVAIQGPAELGELFILYGLGFVAIFACISAMYGYAFAKRDVYEWDDKHASRARFWCRHYALFCVVGVISILLAWTQVGIYFGLPGFVYASIGLTSFIHANRYQKKYGPIDD